MSCHAGSDTAIDGIIRDGSDTAIDGIIRDGNRQNGEATNQKQ